MRLSDGIDKLACAVRVEQPDGSYKPLVKKEKMN